MHTKSLVLANKMLFGKLLGAIPGPLIFGALIDNACIDWATDCNGEKTKCNVYDTDRLASWYIGSKFQLN